MHEIVTVDCRSEINYYLNSRSLLLFGLSYLGYLKQKDKVGLGKGNRYSENR